MQQNGVTRKYILGIKLLIVRATAFNPPYETRYPFLYQHIVIKQQIEDVSHSTTFSIS